MRYISHLCYKGGRTGYSLVLEYNRAVCNMCRDHTKSIDISISDHSKLIHHNMMLNSQVPVIKYDTIFTLHYYLKNGHLKLARFDLSSGLI